MKAPEPKVASRREIALKRFNDLLRWHSAAKTRNRIFFFVFQTLVIVLSGITPILILTLPADSRTLQALPAALASLLAGLMGLYQFNEGWIRWARAVEELRSEIVKFETRTGPDYPENIDEAELIRHFIVRIEQINSGARAQWAQQRSLSGTTSNSDNRKNDQNSGQ